MRRAAKCFCDAPVSADDELVIRNARVRGQKQNVDIAIDGKKISAVGPKLPAMLRIAV
jgi:hypothetical protein